MYKNQTFQQLGKLQYVTSATGGTITTDQEILQDSYLYRLHGNFVVSSCAGNSTGSTTGSILS